MSFKDKKDKFLKVTKLIIKTKLSKKQVTLETYRDKIIEAFNDFTNYCRSKYNSVNTETKEEIVAEYNKLKVKLNICFTLLNCQYKINSRPLSLLLESEVGPPSPGESSSPENSSIEDENSDSEEENDDLGKINIDLEENNDLEKEKVIPVDNKLPNMAEPTTLEFLRLCGETIPNNYSGDPLHLKPFLNAIDLLQVIATNDALKVLLLQFIKTRLTSNALEKLNDTDNTIDLIKTRLTNCIKPENEKIIKGKMAALKADRNSLTDFSKQAENLAECLKRALVLDGIPSQKANTMAIDETVAMCKNSARSDYVKSVLASTSYQNPKEVVAKFIIETGNDKTDKQILSYQAGKKPNFKTNNSNDKRQFSNQNNYRYNNNYQRSNWNRSKNNSYNKEQHRSYSRNDYNRQRNNQYNNNNRNVRYTNSGNSHAPQRYAGEIELIPPNQQNLQIQQ